MNKRQFLKNTAALASIPVCTTAQALERLDRTPTLLTITGAISRSNRGPFNPALDQLMHKQQVTFDRAYVFDYAAITALPSVSIKPTIEYDGKRHELRGPALSTVISETGAHASNGTKLLVRALDGYAVVIDMPTLQHYNFIVATHLDDLPLPLGGLGPLWVVYDADRHTDMAGKPLNQRFVLCPWGVYHIEVQARVKQGRT